MEDDRIALFDLDGSLADFEGSLRARMNALRGPNEPEISENTCCTTSSSTIRTSVHGWISSRRSQASGGTSEDGFTVLGQAIRLGFAINVLSKGPTRLSTAWSEKHEWCLRQPQLAGADIHLTMNKALTYGLMLYDDFPPYMDAWLASRPRGLGIMPVRP